MNAKQHADQVDIDLVRAMVLNSLRRYRTKFNRSHGELVICVDGKNHWRKKIFPYYKENRKKAKQNSKVDWDIIIRTIYTIAKELYLHFPYKVVSVDTAEADDAIAILTKEYHDKEPIMIVSGDKDLIQLQHYPNVRQYDPIRDRFLETDDPKRFLIEHILRGDDSDGIPNFLSDNDTFVNKDKRQKALYSKKLDVWVDDLDAFKKSEEYEKYKENITRNRLLIDLRNIPVELEERIKNQYEKAPQSKRANLLSFFSEKGLSTLLENIREF